jgi:type II secretory pathway component PulK
MILPKNRRGAALVVALLTLMVVVLISGAVLQSLLVARRQSLAIEHELQAMWLAEAALERATNRLQHDSAYNGETWAVAVTKHDAKDAEGSIEIRVKQSAAAPADQQITARATFPTDSIRQATVERTISHRTAADKSESNP